MWAGLEVGVGIDNITLRENLNSILAEGITQEY